MDGWMDEWMDGETDDKHNLTDKYFTNNKLLLTCINVLC